MRTHATVLVGLTAATALGQMPGEVMIQVDASVLAPGESTSVRLWAGFDSAADYAMCCILTDLLADSGGVDIAGAWSDVALVTPMNGPGSTFGTPEAGGYTGIIAGQPHFLGSADPTNPIAFWEATFTAPTDAGAFTVDLSTFTTRFEVYLERDSMRWESRLDGLTEGAVTITVIPAPASALVLLGAFALRRRR